MRLDVDEPLTLPRSSSATLSVAQLVACAPAKSPEATPAPSVPPSLGYPRACENLLRGFVSLARALQEGLDFRDVTEHRTLATRSGALRSLTRRMHVGSANKGPS